MKCKRIKQNTLDLEEFINISHHIKVKLILLEILLTGLNRKQSVRVTH